MKEPASVFTSTGVKPLSFTACQSVLGSTPLGDSKVTDSIPVVRSNEVAVTPVTRSTERRKPPAHIGHVTPLTSTVACTRAGSMIWAGPLLPLGVWHPHEIRGNAAVKNSRVGREMVMLMAPLVDRTSRANCSSSGPLEARWAAEAKCGRIFRPASALAEGPT